MFCFIVASLFADAQKTPPTVVSDAFAQKFQNAENVKWDREEANEWEAEFLLLGEENSASFDLSGKWLETEVELEESELPEVVKTAVVKQFPGAEIEEASTIETSEFKGYEIALEIKGKDIEVLVTKDGKLTIKKESDEKKDKD